MLMRTIHNILGFILATAILTSCVRENESIEPYEAPKGGKGGNATITVQAQHHEKNINNAQIWVKYAAGINEGEKWDDSFAAGGAVTLDSMKQGDYFFYAEGTDTDIPGPHTQELKGSASFKVVDTLKKEYKVFIQIDDWHHHQPGK